MNPKENLLRAIRRDHPQWVPYGLEATVWTLPPVIERPEHAGHDSFGVHWSFELGAEGGTYPTVGGHAITDIDRWREQLTIPDVGAMDWGAVEAQAEAVDREAYLVMGFVEMGLSERSYLLLGMEEALTAYLTHPDQMSSLLGTIADYKIDLINHFHDHAQIEMIWYGDDWGTQANLFLPPDVWRRVIRPHTQRIYDCMLRRGIMIYQHSCGKIEAIFGDLVEMGAHVWNPCQPCNDLARLKRDYGARIAFSGGLDSQFVLGRPGVTAEEVRAEVRRRIDQMADGGGYVASPSHSVPYDPAILEAMETEIASYGRQVYRGQGCD